MPCNRNKYSHCRSELMLLVKKACGSIDWDAFNKSADGVTYCRPMCDLATINDGQCKCEEIPNFLMGHICDDYYLPIGSPSLNECIAVRRCRYSIGGFPPTITLYDVDTFQQRYLHYVRPTSHCEVCEKEFELGHLWERSRFCWVCDRASDKEKTQRLMLNAERHLYELKQEITNERRNERERKRIASSEAAE